MKSSHYRLTPGGAHTRHSPRSVIPPPRFDTRRGVSPPGFGGRAMAQTRFFFSSPRACRSSLDRCRGRLDTADRAVAVPAPRVDRRCRATFSELFPGNVVYAVKSNPEARVLRAVGLRIRNFDCASLAEVALVRKLLPAAEIHFMHPVKSRAAIRYAFDVYNVTDFVFDSANELAKILPETVSVGLVGDPPVLGLVVRLALPKGGAVYDLSGKFGAPLDEVVNLLRVAWPRAARLGIAFHVGSQCLQPDAYARAIALAGRRSQHAAFPSTSSMSAAPFRSAIPT